MCCRRGPRRQPLVVTFGQYAYNRYQENKQARALNNSSPSNEKQSPATSQLERRSSPPPEVLEHEANSEILEKAGIKPPSYDDAVQQRSAPAFSDEKEVGRVRSQSASSTDLSDAESEGDAQGEFVGSRRLNGDESVSGEKPVMTHRQRRRAEKAARKAEKAVRRAESVALKM